MKKFSKWFNIIREIFLPLLEPLPVEKKEKINKRLKELGNSKNVLGKINDITKENTENFTNLINSLLKSQRERFNIVERKATTLISVDGLIIVLIINFATIIPQINGFIRWIILALFLCSILYFGGTFIYALKCLIRRKYQEIDVKYIVQQTGLSGIEFSKRILSSQIAVFENNSYKINEKVSYMAMSHAYFIRAVVSVILLGILYITTSIIN